MEKLTCPFCDFVDEDHYFLAQHVELTHPENGESPFIVKEDFDGAYQNDTPATASQALPSNHQDETGYVECPHGCGEQVPATELLYHTDFHVAEGMALDEGSYPAQVKSSRARDDQRAMRDVSNTFSTGISDSLRNYGQLRTASPLAQSEKRRVSASFKDLLLGSPTKTRVLSKAATSTKGKVKRLGSAELGPYAHETQMPTWLRKMLEEGGKATITTTISPNGTLLQTPTIANETPGLIPVLAHLSQLDPTVEQAYYCSPHVRHVAKLPREGGFCGYRNIQMLISYIRDSRAPGHTHFSSSSNRNKLPTVLQLQDQIELAWSMGHNSSGRIETGGIKGTRKYIGTPEAQAYFLSLGIDCEANAFTRVGPLHADENLIFGIADEYFHKPRKEEKVLITDRPPIYLQHRGHSMTIVGIEIRRNGDTNLMVFDPMYNPSPAMKKLARQNELGAGGGSVRIRTDEPAKLLRAYRRGLGYLGKYNMFEVLRLTDQTVKNGDGDGDGDGDGWQRIPE